MDQLEAARGRLKEEKNVTVFNVASHPYDGFIFEEITLSAAVEKGLDAGADQFYLVKDRDEENNLTLGGVCFFINDRAHIVHKQADEQTESVGAGENTGRPTHRYGRDEGEKEKQRKQELAEELLSEYDDQLREAEKFEIKNRLERIDIRRVLNIRERVEQEADSEEEKQRKQELAEELLSEYNEYLQEDERLKIKNRLEQVTLSWILHIQERVEKEASADPGEEKRLAKAVYDDDRFSGRFNSTDTEMLLNDLDIEFDPNNIRLDEVHKRAKSLLKINK